jgi:hypothetical protein
MKPPIRFRAVALVCLLPFRFDGTIHRVDVKMN